MAIDATIEHRVHVEASGRLAQSFAVRQAHDDTGHFRTGGARRTIRVGPLDALEEGEANPLTCARGEMNLEHLGLRRGAVNDGRGEGRLERQRPIDAVASAKRDGTEDRLVELGPDAGEAEVGDLCEIGRRCRFPAHELLESEYHGRPSLPCRTNTHEHERHPEAVAPSLAPVTVTRSGCRQGRPLVLGVARRSRPPDSATRDSMVTCISAPKPALNRPRIEAGGRISRGGIVRSCLGASRHFPTSAAAWRTFCSVFSRMVIYSPMLEPRPPAHRATASADWPS